MKLLWGTAALSLVASGCSFAMRTAPSDPSERTPEAAQACTSSYLVPTLDGVSAAVGGDNIAVSAAADDKVRIYGREVDKDVGLGLGIAQLAAFGIAATYGYIQATRCKELGHEQRVLTDDEVAARPADPPPSPGMPPPLPSGPRSGASRFRRRLHPTLATMPHAPRLHDSAYATRSASTHCQRRTRARHGRHGLRNDDLARGEEARARYLHAPSPAHHGLQERLRAQRRPRGPGGRSRRGTLRGARTVQSEEHGRSTRRRVANAADRARLLDHGPGRGHGQRQRYVDHRRLRLRLSLRPGGVRRAHPGYRAAVPQGGLATGVEAIARAIVEELVDA